MRKDRNKSLENIANGFRAAHKINTIRNSSLQTSDTRTSVRKAEPDVLKEMLQVLAEFSPDKYRSNLASSLDQSSLYADTFKNLKQHLRDSSSRSMKSDDIIDAMRIVKPAVKGKNEHMIDKVLRIYEILKEE